MLAVNCAHFTLVPGKTHGQVWLAQFRPNRPVSLSRNICPRPMPRIQLLMPRTFVLPHCLSFCFISSFLLLHLLRTKIFI